MTDILPLLYTHFSGAKSTENKAMDTNSRLKK